MAKERASIPGKEAYKVWGASAGRCAICKDSVLESETLALEPHVGELAHIIGADNTSPRGQDPMPVESRNLASNLLLLCRGCHKVIDQPEGLDKYPVDTLRQIKHEHEQQMAFLTGLDDSRKSWILRVVSDIRGTPPDLPWNTVMDAVASSGYFPKLFPGSAKEAPELDMTGFGDPDNSDDFQAMVVQVSKFAKRIHDEIRSSDVSRLAIFGFARIPILVALGAALDDKVETLIFQRHRGADGNAWKWPGGPNPVPGFSINMRQRGPAENVALVVCLSGTIPQEDLPDHVREDCCVYCIEPDAPAVPGVDLVRSPAALRAFEMTVRRFLAQVERDHPRLGHIDLFPAVGVASATVLGQCLMGNVSPAWHVYDRDQTHGRFVEALEVRK